MSLRLLDAMSIFALAMGTSSPATAQLADLEESEIGERVQAVVERAMDRPEAVGLSVAVVRGNEVVFNKGFGKANLEWDTDADSETIFRIGSITKQFTAAAIMKLVEREQMALDDPISQYLPDFDVGGRTITVRQLLNHNSGIPNYTAQPNFMRDAAGRNLTHEQLLEWVIGVDFDFEPGEGWNYSNTNYYLLGMIIEMVDGRSYAVFMDQEFFEPLGLTHTSYGDLARVIPKRAEGYRYNMQNGQFFNDTLSSMNAPGAAGALVSSAGDLAKWHLALTSGRAVQPESFRQMVESTIDTGQPSSSYGFGLMIREGANGSIIGHGGGIQGFNSSASYLPEQQLYVAVISNSQALPSTAIEQQIVGALTSAEYEAIQRVTAHPDSEAAVRRTVAEMASDEPDFSFMTEALARVAIAQQPNTSRYFAFLGELQEVTFREVNLRGADIFDLTFANGTAEMQIVIGEDGRVAMAGLRPTSALPSS